MYVCFKEYSVSFVKSRTWLGQSSSHQVIQAVCKAFKTQHLRKKLRDVLSVRPDYDKGLMLEI